MWKVWRLINQQILKSLNQKMNQSHIQLAHGGGGRLSSQLIAEEILSRFANNALNKLPDAATLEILSDKIVYTTDSFVVNPIEFPGGNIGDLSVYGTVNDISASGGKPLWLSLGLILEEGLPFKILRKILDSIKKAADKCNVQIVTGDTKVVAKGQCDSMYINTSGIGEALENFNLDKTRIVPGDIVLVSGPIGDHGIAVMSLREGINIKNGPLSDTAPVHRLALNAYKFAEAVKFMRDPTRGGLAAILNETVSGQNFGILLEENAIPVSPGTRAVSEMLGLDLLNIASEGRLVLISSPAAAAKILEKWRKLPEGRNASIIGSVTKKAGHIILQTLTGGQRLVDVPQGDLLPRIC